MLSIPERALIKSVALTANLQSDDTHQSVFTKIENTVEFFGFNGPFINLGDFFKSKEELTHYLFELWLIAHK